jgi:hypothetical protein
VEEVLADEHRMKRLVATFCDGVFSYADEDKAGQIIDESLKICGCDTNILAQVVQTKFFAGHTPFYWLLVNRHSKPKAPPLLEKLFRLCKHVAPTTLEDMTDGLPHRLDDDLYKIVKRFLTPFCLSSITSFFRDEDQQPAAKAAPNNSNCGGQLKLSIPLFFDRLLVDKEISFKFVAMGKTFYQCIHNLRADYQTRSVTGNLWLLKAIVEDTSSSGNPEWAWHFELSETHSAIGYKKTFAFERRASIKILNSNEGTSRANGMQTPFYKLGAYLSRSACVEFRSSSSPRMFLDEGH